MNVKTDIFSKVSMWERCYIVLIEANAEKFLGFQGQLVYKASSRTVRRCLKKIKYSSGGKWLTALIPAFRGQRQ